MVAFDLVAVSVCWCGVVPAVGVAASADWGDFVDDEAPWVGGFECEVDGLAADVAGFVCCFVSCCELVSAPAVGAAGVGFVAHGAVCPMGAKPRQT